MSDINENMKWYDNLIKGSIHSINLIQNDAGVYKKKTVGDMGDWNKITETKLIEGHQITFVRCGEINNISVLDFDDVALYEQFVNTYNNQLTDDGEPVFGRDNFPTLKTKNGYHIYFKYTNKINQPQKDLLNIDIQGNNKRVYGAGSTYKLPDNTDFVYDWVVKEPIQDMPDRLIKFINEKGGKTITKTTVPIVDTNNIEPDKQMILDACDIISLKYINYRESWLQCLCALKYEGINEDFAKKFSLRSDTMQISDEDWEKNWKSLYEDTGEKQCKAGTIFHYAKLSNPTKFYELQAKYKPNKEFNLDKATERSFATLFDNLESHIVVYCEDDFEFYVWYKNKWRMETKDGCFIRTIISKRLTDYFNNLLKKIRLDTNADPTSLKLNEIKIFDIMKMIEKTNWLNNIWKELQSIIKCKCEKIEFDTNPDVIGFNNIKYNFKTHEWTPIVYNDFISLNTGNDWVEPNKEEMTCITRLFEEIFPNPEIRRSYLSVLYGSCIGGKKDKFVIANGGGANGKGLINELMKVLLGDYAYEAPVSLLTREFRGGANPELANIHKKRMVLFKEPDASEKLFLGNIKSIVDNDTINARQLYKGNCKVVLHAMVIMELNLKLKFSSKPTNAETRRFMDILFESTFTEDDTMLNDNTLSNIHRMNKDYKSVKFQNNHVCALFKYIIDNADTEIYNPECVRERTKCYIEGEDTFANWYKEEYEITGDKDDILKIKDMFEHYKDSDDYKNMRKDERPNLNRFLLHTVSTDKNLNSRYKADYRCYIDGVQKRSRSVLIGMRLKHSEDDAPDNDN
jgi:phage/plasmid-associated DNA primase